MVADQKNLVHISSESLFGTKGGHKVVPSLFQIQNALFNVESNLSIIFLIFDFISSFVYISWDFNQFITL